MDVDDVLTIITDGTNYNVNLNPPPPKFVVSYFLMCFFCDDINLFSLWTLFSNISKLRLKIEII